jgi:ABC-2 type transport system ATP-binding protein
MIESTPDLSMFFGKAKALDKIFFQLQKGEIVGLVGPNGAGKSTLLKIVTSYLYPSCGTIYVCGRDIREEYLNSRKKIGYLPEQLPLYSNMTVQEYLKFIGNARGYYNKNLESRLLYLKEKCGLTLVYSQLISLLSKGYKQRVGLAQALIHDPEILILDEPTSGLDPCQTLEIRKFIEELHAQGKTILFSSHILQEVECVAKKFFILNCGKMVADGTLEQLACQCCFPSLYKLVLPFDIPCELVKQAIQKISSSLQIEEQEQQEEKIYWIQGDSSLRDNLSDLIFEKKWKLLELTKKQRTLEEIFFTLIQKKT